MRDDGVRRKVLARRTIWERFRYKYVRLQVRSICVADDKIAQPRICDHRSGTRVEPLILPIKAVARS